MFRTVSLSIVRSLALYTQQQVYVIQVMPTACQRDKDGTSYLTPRCTQSSLMNDAGTVTYICLYTLYNSYNTRVSTLMPASSALLVALEKLRKGTISFVMFVRSHGTRLPPDRFSTNLIFEDFTKNCRENSSFMKIGQELRVLYMKTNTHFFYHISLIYSQNEKCFGHKLQRKSKHKFCVQ